MILFDSDGKEYKDAKNFNPKILEKSNIYSGIISFTPELSATKQFTLNDAKKYMKIFYREFLKNNDLAGFNKENTKFYAVMHPAVPGAGEDAMTHTHLHFVLYQPEGVEKLDRVKVSLRGLNMAKIAIAKEIEIFGLDKIETEVFKQKRNILDFAKTTIFDIGIQNMRTECQYWLGKEFNQLRPKQAELNKLFKAQPVQHTYKDKNGQEHAQKGLSLEYDNLTKPCYSLKILKQFTKKDQDGKEYIDIKALKKSGNKPTIQGIQIEYKNLLDRYTNLLIYCDSKLNQGESKYFKAKEKYFKMNQMFLAGDEKHWQNPQSFSKVLSSKVNEFDKELFKQAGNILMSTVLKTNKLHYSYDRTMEYYAKRYAWEQEHKKSGHGCRGNKKLKSEMNNRIQKLVADYVGNKSKINVRNINLLGDNKWMAKYRREKELERMADEEGISVTELKERIEEYYKSKGL